MLCRTWCTWKFSARMILETPRKLKFLGGFTKIYPRNLYTAEISGWLLASFEPPIYPHVWKEIHAGLVLVTRTHRTKKGSDLAFWIGGVGCTTKHSCKDIVLYKTSYWTKMIYHYNIIYIYILKKIYVPSIFCIIRTVVEIWKKKKHPVRFFQLRGYHFQDIIQLTMGEVLRSLFGKGLESWRYPRPRPSFRPRKIYTNIHFWTERKSWKKNFSFASSRIELVSCLRKSGR